jgi:hypothetical protein
LHHGRGADEQGLSNSTEDSAAGHSGAIIDRKLEIGKAKLENRNWKIENGNWELEGNKARV